MRRSSLVLVAVTLLAVVGTSFYSQGQPQNQPPRPRADETLAMWILIDGGKPTSLTWLHRQLQIRLQPDLSINRPGHVNHWWVPAESASVRSCQGNANLVTFSHQNGCWPHVDLQFSGLPGINVLSVVALSSVAPIPFLPQTSPIAIL